MDDTFQGLNQANTEAVPVAENLEEVSSNSVGSAIDSYLVNNANGGKPKRYWIVVLAIMVVLILVTICLLIWQPWKQEDDVQVGGDSSISVDVSEEELTGDVVTANKVSNDIEVTEEINLAIRELYKGFASGTFYGINSAADNLSSFRFNLGMRSGQPDRYLMLTLAMDNLEKTMCRGIHMIDLLGYAVETCYDGNAMRAEVERLFGLSLQLTEGDVAGYICHGYPYDPKNDEFFAAGDGCGFASPRHFASAIARVEREGDEVYVYEKVLLIDDDEHKAYNNISDDGEMNGEYVGPFDVPYESADNYDSNLEKNEKVAAEYALQSGDDFKWTFRKTVSGNYVFEKIERL